MFWIIKLIFLLTKPTSSDFSKVLFGDLIYSQETVKGVAATKTPIHLPKIKAPDEVKADQSFEVEVSVGPHPSTLSTTSVKSRYT